MIVCVRTVRIPPDMRGRFLAWIEENRELRERHGILFELVLERSPLQNPPKAMQPAEPAPNVEGEDVALVLTGWTSHDAFDAWIETPDRDRLTASDVHSAVDYGPITRYDVAGGYVHVDGLAAVTELMREVLG